MIKYLHWLFFPFFLTTISFTLQAQYTITTLGLSTSSVCPGTPISVNFTRTGEFTDSYSVQISDGGDYKTIASGAASYNSRINTFTISAVIPITQATGTTYSIRVNADNPAVIGSVSPTPITVKSFATATLAGAQTIYAGQSTKLMVTFAGDGPWTFTYNDSTIATGAVTRSIPTSTSTNPYSFSINPLKTTAYYLTNVGNDCGNDARLGPLVTVIVSSPLAVDDQSLQEALQTYPVPAASQLTVRIVGLTMAQTARLELMDINGKTINEQETRHETSVVNLEQHPSGVYVLRVRVGERTATKRIVKL